LEVAIDGSAAVGNLWCVAVLGLPLGVEGEQDCADEIWKSSFVMTL